MNRHPILPVLILLMTLATGLFPQAELLQSGPMVGYSEMREVLLWVQTTQPARVKFAYVDAADTSHKLFTPEVQTEKQSAYIAKVAVENLEPGHHYQYELYINDQLVKRPYPLSFQTQKLWQWREDPPPFSIAVGSCAYINEPAYDRPGKPYGSEYEIFQAIFEKHPDAMLWLGDNVYLREADWYSRSGIIHRYTHTRSVPELQPLLGSVHHYAIWDDHDYGPNDSDRSFRQKEQTLRTFKLFWGNSTYGIDGKPGITTMFQWADVDFFLLDNRYYRTPNDYTGGKRTILGEDQFNWLIEALTYSKAPFKIIAIGGQVLNPVAKYENYSNYPSERERLLNAIAHENITGVIFLTGDRHFTELSKLERYGRYPLYDLTVSPFTAGPAKGMESEANYLRVPGTLVSGKHNFAILHVEGPRKDRILTITVYDKDGQKQWQKSIAAKDLQ